MIPNIKQQFPALANSDSIYLDSASSCQTPSHVINAISDYLMTGHGNPHRGMYEYAERAEEILNECRSKVAKLINATPEQIIFTKSTTESINLVAHSFRERLNTGDTILTSEMEHHANLLPWQRLQSLTGNTLKYIPINSNVELCLNQTNIDLADNCKLLTICHVSNLLGTENPVKELAQLAHAHGVPILIDGAQMVAHQKVDVRSLNCDYYAFSAHKMYGPAGIGVLYAKNPESLEPLLLGGGIVSRVSRENHSLLAGIERFESGTPNMPGLVGLSAAIDFINQLEIEKLNSGHLELIRALRRAAEEHSFKIISHPNSHNLISFVHNKFHSHDVATILSANDIAVRAGHHCAQPCLNALGYKQCIRASIGVYNSKSDIERFSQALSRVSAHLL